jgi:hypothetical protein
MSISAALAVWKWDTVFPDRRDYMNLAPLPITPGMIFRANLLAIALLVVIFSVDVNAASSVLFPIIVNPIQPSIAFTAKFAAVHVTGVVLASLFSFAAIFAVAGTLLAALPYTAFRRISLYLRLLLLLGVMALLASSFAVPPVLATVARDPQSPLRWVPSVWFLALVQMLRGRASAALLPLARIAVEAVSGAIGLAMASYAVCYRRSFLRAAETSDIPPAGGRRFQEAIFRLLDATLLRTPIQRAGYRFCLLTLLRNERHGLAVGSFVGIALIAASQTLFAAVNHRLRDASGLPAPELLAIPLLLAYFAMVGMRVVFAIPAELKANWVFRFLLQRSWHPSARPESAPEADSRECARLARKFMLVAVLPWLWALALPLYVHYWGWRVGLIHIVIVTAWCCLLAEALVARFRKMPFTCESPSFEQSTVTSALFYVAGAFAFIEITSMIESGALQNARAFVPLTIIAIAWAVMIRERRNDVVERDADLQFEDAPANTYELLRLSGS